MTLGPKLLIFLVLLAHTANPREDLKEKSYLVVMTTAIHTVISLSKF